MLLGSRQYEDSMCRRLFKGLQERIEGRLGKHMHLIDYIYAVPAHLRGNPDLLHESLDVIHAIVRCCIKLVDTVGAAL